MGFGFYAICARYWIMKNTHMNWLYPLAYIYIFTIDIHDSHSSPIHLPRVHGFRGHRATQTSFFHSDVLPYWQLINIKRQLEHKNSLGPAPQSTSECTCSVLGLGIVHMLLHTLPSPHSGDSRNGWGSVRWHGETVLYCHSRGWFFVFKFRQQVPYGRI